MAVPTIEESFAHALIEHVRQKYESLRAMTLRHDLTLFNMMTPANISKIDSEISANTQILNEACSFMQMADIMSFFYSDVHFSDLVTEYIVKSRVVQTNSAAPMQSTLSEYFMSQTARQFLEINPHYVGIYMFVFVQSMT